MPIDVKDLIARLRKLGADLHELSGGGLCGDTVLEAADTIERMAQRIDVAEAEGSANYWRAR